MDNPSNIFKHFESLLASIKSESDLESLKTAYLGRKGLINNLIQQLATLPVKKRKNAGQKINQLKTKIGTALTQTSNTIHNNQKVSPFPRDTSLPGKEPKLGQLHPTTETIRQINSFFNYLGYSVYEGPEIETSENNFEKLNLPPDHPARDLQDTLYIREPELLLRTHTSSVEIRAMTTESLPLRIVVPGKVYRNETSNLTNNSMFYQYEGLVVDKNITMADLKGTLVAFVKFLYGKDTKTRFRCKYYPQVEPGAGLDVQCTFCAGSGCQVCKYRGFIEVLGAGMVHPQVLKSCGIDPNKWSGFAFGMGLDRLVMLRYGIEDIRKLYNGELVIV